MSRWRRQLVRVPARRFGDTADERTPRYWHARYDSPAAFLATRLICERTRADVTAVALAAAAVELARITGIGPSVLQTVVHNRFRPGLAEVVGPVAQTGLCVLDVEDCTFDDVVAKAWRASIQAYMNSYYNPVRLNDAIARFGADRGAEIDMSCYFNDRRLQGQQPTGPSPDGDQVLEALDQARFTWLDPTVNPSTHLFVTVMDSPTGPNSLLWQVDADTRYFPPAHIERIARGMEQMLVKAAFDPAASTGISTGTGTGIHNHAAQDVQAA